MYFVFARKVKNKFFNKLTRQWELIEDIEFFLGTHSEDGDVINFKNHNRFEKVCEIYGYDNVEIVSFETQMDYNNLLDFINKNVDYIWGDFELYFVYNLSQLNFLNN